MGAMMTLGLMLTAKDMLSPILGRASESVIKLNTSAKSLSSPLMELSSRTELVGGKFKFGTTAITGMGSALNPLTNKFIGTKTVLRDFYTEVEKTADKTTSFMDKLKEGGLAYGGFFAVGKGLASTVLKDFGDLEDAQNKLKSTLMDSKGAISGYYQKIATESDKLGSALPGTAADFYNMASSLKSLGISEESIVGGALKSSAYLATVMKISYEEAADSTAKFKSAFNIANKDLLPFVDDIQRMGHMGVKIGEMAFGFSKVGATLKGVGLEGIKAARSVEPLLGLLIQNKFSGEEGGSAIGDIIKSAVVYKGSKKEKDNLKMGVSLNFVDEKGSFKGIDNMMTELLKLNKFSTVKKANIMENLGISPKSGAGNALFVLLASGQKGINAFNADMKKQADLNQRAKLASQGLISTWEALTGTASNLAATIGSSIAPELKGLANFFNAATDKITKFSKQHPILTHNVALVTGGFIAISGVLGITALGISALTYGFTAMGIKTLFSATAQWAFNTSLGKSFLTMGWVIGRMVIMGGILGGMAIKTGVVTAAQWLLNGAMLANPIGALVLGFTALVGIGVVLYKNFLPFRNLIDSINQSIDHVLGKDGWLGKIATLGIDAPTAPKFPTAQKPAVLAASAPRKVTVPTLKKREPLHSTTNNHVNIVVNNPKSNVDVTKAVHRAIGYGDRP